MELQKIFQAAKGGNYLTAISSLSEWLRHGRLDLYQKIRRIEQSNRSQSTVEVQQALMELVRKIEELPASEIQFLNQMQAGERYMQAEQWQEAVLAYQSALALHQPTYRLRQKQLQAQLDACHTAQEMAALIEKGNEAYLAGKWDQAGSYFQQAMKIHQPGLGVDAQELSEVIARCNQGQEYVDWVKQGQEALRSQEHERTAKLYRKALRIGHPDFRPAPEVLREELRLVEQTRTLNPATTAPVPLMQRPWVRLSVVVLLLSFSGLGIWQALDRHNRGLDPSAETPLAVAPEPASRPLPSAPKEPSSAELSAEDQAEKAPMPELNDSPDPAPRFPTYAEDPHQPPAGFSSPPVDAVEPAPLVDTSRETQLTNPLASVRDTQARISVPQVDSTPVEMVEDASEAPDSAPAVVATRPAPLRDKPAQPTVAPKAPLAFAEVMPSFPGGANAMASYFSQRIRYPEVARENEIEGTVYIQMVVQANGSLAQIRLARGIGYGCDEEALRVVKQMPNWVPGKQDGVAVPVIYTIPIAFRIP